MNNNNDDGFEADVIAETEHFAVWRSVDEEDVLYHIELGMITLHLPSEDWQELVVLVKSAE